MMTLFPFALPRLLLSLFVATATNVRAVDSAFEVGPCSSPVLVDNLLIFHVDGRDTQYVIALDKANGKTVWKTLRSIDFSALR
jgi:outer membrane protein assembly factor BamB